jgi:hypothetical protein
VVRKGTAAVGRPGPTAQVISIRRRDELAAQAALGAVRAEVELGRQQAATARLLLLDAEQAVGRARAAQRELQGPQLAGDLWRQSTALTQLVDSLHRRRASEAAAARALLGLLQQLERRRTEWLGAVARREAAELHEALERREQRRQRREREALHDDEARQRFASAARLPNRQA